MAKEYIDRIDKLNLFYLFFMLKSVSQWRSAPLLDSINYFPILFISELFIGMINDTSSSKASNRFCQTRIYDKSTLNYMTIMNASSDDSFEFMVIGI